MSPISRRQSAPYIKYVIVDDHVISWESGGILRHNAEVQLVGGPDGERLRPTHILRAGKYGDRIHILGCGLRGKDAHARFSAPKLTILYIYCCNVKRLVKIKARALLVSADGETKIPLNDPRLIPMWDAARWKAGYHCVWPVYFKHESLDQRHYGSEEQS